MAWTIYENSQYGAGHGWSNTYEGTTDAQVNNAIEIYNYFGALGWSLNAIAAMICEMQYESYLNPGQGEVNGYGGIGLVQWTDYPPWEPNTAKKNFLAFCNANGVYWTDPSAQMYWLSIMPSGFWFKRNQYYLPFDQFKVSTLDPVYLARVWFESFERGTWTSIRGVGATGWYNYLAGGVPAPSPDPVPNPQPPAPNPEPWYPPSGENPEPAPEPEKPKQHRMPIYFYVKRM